MTDFLTTLIASGLTSEVADLPQIRSLFGWATSQVLQTYTVDFQISVRVLAYLRRHAASWGKSSQAYMSSNLFVRPSDSIRPVAMKLITHETKLFWYKGGIIMYSPSADPSNSGAPDESSPRFSFVRGTVQFDELILEALNEDYLRRIGQGESTVRSRKKGRFHVRYVVGSFGKADQHGDVPINRATDMESVWNPENDGMIPLGWDPADLGMPQREKAMDTLFLPEQAEEVVQELRRWKGSEKWFRDRLVPWRRGYLFYGPAGTGKTSLARAAAEELDIPVFVYDLASLSNAELIAYWEEMLSQSPVMALLEDIDSVFNGRENKTGGPLTFDCLLNRLDGIERSDGLVLVMTTNVLKHLDSALGIPDSDTGRSSRPGRIDRTVYLAYISKAHKRKMAERILREGDFEDLITDEEVTPAQFQEICVRRAQKNFWAQEQTA